MSLDKTVAMIHPIGGMAEMAIARSKKRSTAIF
jgi:hypothetical protein